MHAQEMIRTHPHVQGNMNDTLVQCINECYDCAQTCIACADACRSCEQACHDARRTF